MSKAIIKDVRFTAISSLAEYELQEEWQERLQLKLSLLGYQIGEFVWDEAALSEREEFGEPSFKKQARITDLQTHHDSPLTIEDCYGIGTSVDLIIPFPRDAGVLTCSHLYRTEKLCRLLIEHMACGEADMVVDLGEKRLWIAGSAEEIEQFGKLEWPQDSERGLLLDWLSKPGAAAISLEGENLYVITGNQKALLLQSPINGMLLSVSEEARSQYHQFVDDAWECELEKTLPFASLEQWIEDHGEPDFELPPVEFEGDRQNVVRQIGYLNMSPNYVVILRSYEDGSITIILAGKAVDSH